MTMNKLQMALRAGFGRVLFVGMAVLSGTASAQVPSDSVGSPAWRQRVCAEATNIVANAGQVTSLANRLVRDTLYTALTTMYQLSGLRSRCFDSHLG
jgi:hypothetical protein